MGTLLGGWGRGKSLGQAAVSYTRAVGVRSPQNLAPWPRQGLAASVLWAHHWKKISAPSTLRKGSWG